MRNTIKKFIGVAVIGAFMMFSTDALAQKVHTVKGEVLDLSCYMSAGDQGRGQVHKACTIKCLEKGLPAGLLSSDGKVYLLVENHRLEKAYKTAIDSGGEIVEITGRVYEKDGLKSLFVEKIKKF